MVWQLQRVMSSWALALLLLAVGSQYSDASKPKKPTNIIFMMADDLGWGDVEYNNGTARTPHLNEMSTAAGSLRLNRYYSGGPVCSPTRGTVLTGRNHNRYCVWTANAGNNKPDFAVAERMPLPSYEYTIATAAKAAGYSTAMFGKWHLGDFFQLPKSNPKWPISHPGTHGFDEWMATERSTPTATTNCGCFKPDKCQNGHWPDNVACNNYWGQNTPALHLNDAGVHGFGGAPVPVTNLSTPVPGDDSEYLGNVAESYIRRQVSSGSPFFLYLPFHTVHIRYIAVEPYITMYRKLGNFSATEIDYFGAISAMDAQVGRIRALLRELAIENNTLLWFASDNGPENGTPGQTNGLRGRKRDLTEGGIRVPGLLEWPDRINEHRVVETPIVSSDLMPSFLDLVGEHMPDKRPVDGRSALDIIDGISKNRSSPIGFAYNIGGSFNGTYNVAWVDNQYKIFGTVKKGKLAETYLYDLTKDLAEANDLSAKSPDIAARMITDMVAWLESVENSAKTESQCYSVKLHPEDVMDETDADLRFLE
eukprot:scpid52136/ scgid1026/ N-acetylgalactosamine-6-sulfatase; Chondroitinsulfatase; Galactose-6-sulfate sulfatase; N-acetylgalactosamine-6-sulfate sulfatase